MKKFLSLVLALVMAMSLVTVSAGAADFSDKSSIDYSEAIDVMNAVGVVSGYSDGTFRPDAVLTRGAASKIICNMLLGSTSADALSVNSAPFSDVAADSTFAGYIAYMVKEGIVSGYADGTFRPGANLTGYAFMKMLLTALGYDATNEGYVGANWSVAVAKRALSIGLDDGLGETFNGLRPVTRQEACLYALNTLKADMVDYGQNFTVTTNQGVTITSNAKAESVTSKTKGSYANIKDEKPGANDEYVVQLGEKVFTKLMLTTDTDDFGHPCNKWTLSTKTIGKYAKKAVATFDKSTKDSKVVTALTGYEIKASTEKDVKIDDNVTYSYVKPITGYYTNGVESTADKNIQKNGKNQTIADWISGLTEDNNSLIEVFANDDNQITHIVETNFSVGEVVRAATDSKGTTTYRVEGKLDAASATGKTYAKDSANDDTIVLASAVKVDDIVTYVKLGTGSNQITYVYPTTKVSGTVSKVSKDADEITMGGTTYNMNTDNSGHVAAADKADLYIDYLGRVAWADGTGSSDVYYLASIWNENVKGTNHYYAQLVSLTGSVEEIKIDGARYTALGGTDYPEENETKIAVTKGGQNTDGGYLIPAAANVFVYDDYENSTMEATKKSFYDTDAEAWYYVADDVKLLYVDKGGEDLKVSVATGMQKVKNSVMIMVKDTKAKTNTISNIIVMGKPSQAADKLLFKAETTWDAGTTTDKEGKKAPTQKLYLDGESDTYMLKSEAYSAGFYEYTIDESTGRYDLDFCTDNVAVAYVSSKSSDECLDIYSKRYMEMYTLDNDAHINGWLLTDKDDENYDAKNATFYDMTDYNISSVSALYDEIYNRGEDDGDVEFVLFALYDDDKGTITTVYVVKASKATNWKTDVQTAAGFPEN